MEEVMNRVVLIAGCLALWTGSAARAYQVEDLRIEWWTGTGGSRVLLVVDFWPYNGQDDSFAFGYSFDQPEITGLELLEALQAAELGFSYAETAGFLTDIWYVKDGIVYHTGSDWPNSYWSYWLSSDNGESWEYSPIGAGGRILHHGDTDGWLALPGDDWTSQPVTPLVPPTIVGDLNCDGLLSFGDINPFVLALTNPAAYYVQYPDCNRLNADINGDRHVDFRDINPFVTLLSHP
jgi:hypothetical protein